VGIQALNTKYLGYNFRSRLEARWAVFFTEMGLPFEYEPEGFDLDGVWYLPDFRVLYPDKGTPFWQWFEVKPDRIIPMSKDDRRKIELFSKHDSIIILDGPPAFKSYLGGNMFGRESEGFGWLLWSYKERPWIDNEDVFEHVLDCDYRKYISAISAAKSARF